MTYEQFLKLGKLSQVEITIKIGIVIGKRLEYNDFLKLYQLGSFYIELRYSEDQGEVFAIVSSDTDNLLGPYLNAIDISKLL